mgnify:CR=1 FL=1
MQNTPSTQSSLAEVPSGEVATIVSLFGGNGFNRRLTSLGFTPGAELRIVQNYGHGPMIVSIRDSQIALGRGEAAKIIVQRVKE